MQLTMTSNGCKYKSAASLRDDLYRGDEILLLDCRSNDEYRKGHIKNAYNITLPQIMMRRLKSNKLSLEKIVPLNFRQEKEAFLKKCMSHTVLLYDHYSNEINQGNEGSLMVLLQRRMAHEKCNVYILKGGYMHFQRENPEFCKYNTSNNDDEDSSDAADMRIEHTPMRIPSSKPSEEGVTPLLGLRDLNINCDRENKSPVTNVLDNPGGLMARRAKRKFKNQLTINTSARNSEGETENSSSATSSDGHGILSPLNCNNNILKPHEIIDSKSPANFNNFGNGDSPVEIMPYLFLGCHKDATNKEVLKANGITYILNVTPNLPNVFEDDKTFHYKKIAISDHWSQNLSQFFPEAIAFIDEARNKQCGVLVHCLAGISRSVTVTVAYLMQKERWSLNDAYDFVKQRKSNVSPNFNFMGQLLDFEKTLGITGCEDGCDSGIASSSSSCKSSTTPPTLFFTSPAPPTPTSVTNSNTCGSKSGLVPKEHRSIFCLPTPMS